LKPTFTYAATVERIVDGDTLDVDLDLGMRIHVKARLRLEHVNAPEHGNAAGDAATAFVQRLLPAGTPVVVATAKPDKYGRALATVAFQHDAHEVDLATALLQAGHAVPYEGGAR
jgi:micrococcal nuclease